MKKLEPSETPDIVLVEEVREYKEMLTCQSCKVRRKDAVLSKCFHVFCWECLRTRYETRQRKCPKCNATFGANDYHRLFFTNWVVGLTPTCESPKRRRENADISCAVHSPTSQACEDDHLVKSVLVSRALHKTGCFIIVFKDSTWVLLKIAIDKNN